MTEPTKKQQRERAERRRKLDEFWRWRLGETEHMSLDEVNEREVAIRQHMSGLCVRAIQMIGIELPYELRATKLHRDLSLAQLEVLEMLEERVGERLDSAPDHAVDASKFQVEYLHEWEDAAKRVNNHLQEWAEKSMKVCRRARDESAERMREMYQRFEDSETKRLIDSGELVIAGTPEQRGEHWSGQPYDVVRVDLGSVAKEKFVGCDKKAGEVIVFKREGSNEITLTHGPGTRVGRVAYDPRKDPFFHPEVAEQMRRTDESLPEERPDMVIDFGKRHPGWPSAVDSADSDGTLHPWGFK